MDFRKAMETFMEFSEKLLAIIINIVFSLILISPLILVDLFFRYSLLKYPLLFIPLCALYPMALKSMIYAFHMVFVKDKSYYGLFFFKSLKDDFVKSYLYYLAMVGFLYIGLSSTWILINEVSNAFWILYALISVLILTNMIYTSLQLALYETQNIKSTITNSVILTIMYGVISVGLTIILAWMIYNIQYHPLKIIFIGIPVYAGLLVYVHLIIDRNKSRNSEMR